jgi:hypothetical protein
MVSRRRFLAAAGLAALTGCNNRENRTTTPTRTDPPTPSESPSQSSTATPSESATPTSGPTDSSTDENTPTDSATATPDPLADRFGTIVDVADEGIDASGSEPVGTDIEALAGDDTLLRFGQGTYRIHEIEFEDLSNFGMVGNGARLQLQTKGRTIFMAFRHVSDLLVDGFVIDNTATNVAAWADLKVTGGTNVFRNYAVEDFVDVNERTNGFTIMVEGADTSLELDSVDIGRGGVNGAAAFVFPRREFYDPTREAGSLTFRNCVMNGWGKEGLYASPHEGPIRVIGGEYANNAIAQVRIGAGNAPQEAIVRDVTVRIDEIPDYMPSGNRILRGIWLKEGDKATVENCDVTLANLGVNQTPGAIYVNNQFGRATIRDCTITTENVSRPAILIQEPADEYDSGWMPSLDHLPSEWGVTVENVTIVGESPNTAAIELEERDGCTFRDVTIEKTGQGVDGIEIDEVADCRIEGGSITTDRFPVVVEFDDNSSESCALHVVDASLEGTQLEEGGRELATDGDTYCIGADTLPDTPHDESDRLSLTRSEEAAGTATATPTGTPSETGGNDTYTLYGRWLTQ